MSMPEWARDAPDRLVYLSTEGGTVEVHAWDRSSGARRRVTDRPEGTRQAAIDPTGEWIWWFADERGNEHGVWMVEPFDGEAPARPALREIEPAHSVGLALGRGVAVVGTSSDTGTQIHITGPDRPSDVIYRHREFALVAGLSRDERLVAIAHSEHGDIQHPAVRVLDRGGEAAVDLWDGPGLGVRPGPWSPVAGDRRLVVLHEREGPARPAIWAPGAGEPVEVRLDLPGEVVASWYPDASALLLRHDHAGRSEAYRYDIAPRALSRLDCPTGSLVAARVRPDGRLWLDHSSGGMPKRLLEDGVPIFERTAPAGVPYRELRVGAVHGFLAEPTGTRPHPTIFEVHGGPTSLDADAFSASVQAWVDHGFAVALVNYRGSAGYGREWRDAIQGDPGRAELEDLKAVRDHLVVSGVADPRRIVICGGSYGGYLTLLALGLQPEDWCLGIAVAAVADRAVAYEDQMEPLRASTRARFGGTPAERPDLYRERSPITYADRIRAPVLIMSGRSDPRCPIRQMYGYLARLRELGKFHDYYEFEAGHGSLVVEEQIRQAEMQLAFIHRHLGTPAPY
jgi:dipeptidyl aminopeptidase/acylaminoacyl peptidase